MSKLLYTNKWLPSLLSLPIVSFFSSHTFFLSSSVFLSCLSFTSHFCSSSLEENLTVGCNAGCNCVRELYNPVCGADGVMYYSPCHAGCSFINHTESTTGKQVQCTHFYFIYFKKSSVWIWLFSTGNCLFKIPYNWLFYTNFCDTHCLDKLFISYSEKLFLCIEFNMKYLIKFVK